MLVLRESRKMLINKGRKYNSRKELDKSEEHERTLLRKMRKHMVALIKWGRKYKYTCSEISSAVGVNVRTACQWLMDWNKKYLSAVKRGRKRKVIPENLECSLNAMFTLLGPFVGLPVLQGLFPEIPRDHLVEKQHEKRKRFIKDKKYYLHALNWTTPGSVWAMDFAEAPVPVEGKYKYILVIRDLSSGHILKSLSCNTMSSNIVINALKTLFYWYREPLVIKSDNGSAFISKELKRFLNLYGVMHLLSPPGTPEFNGAIEAGMGSLKHKLFYISSRNGTFGYWTCQDIEEARLQANQTSRPRGINGLTPQEMWYNRNIIDTENRNAFRQWVYICRMHEMEKRSLDYEKLSDKERRFIDRINITNALIDCEFLTFKKRRVSPPLKLKKITFIR